jgi:hypothetical protein
MKKIFAVCVLLTTTSTFAGYPSCSPKAGAVIVRPEDGVRATSVSCYQLRRDYYLSNPQEALNYKSKMKSFVNYTSRVAGKYSVYIRSVMNYMIDFTDESFSNESISLKTKKLFNEIDFYTVNGEISDFEASLIKASLEDIENEANNFLVNNNLTTEQRKKFLDLKDRVNHVRLEVALDKINSDIEFKNLSHQEKIEIVKKENAELKEHVEKIVDVHNDLSSKFNQLAKKRLQLEQKYQASFDRQERIKDLKEFSAELQDYKSFAKASLMALGMINPKLAADIAPVVNAGFMLVEAQNKLDLISEEAIAGSTLGPYSMMAMAAFSLMQSGQKENAQAQMYKAIMQALKQISQQIDNLHKDMISGFNGVHDHLFSLEKMIMDKFNIVIEQNYQLQTSVNEIKQEILTLRRKLIADKDTDISNLESEFISKFERTSNRCFANLLGEKTCYREYSEILDELADKNAKLIGSGEKIFAKEYLENFNMERSIGVFYNLISDEMDMKNLKSPLYRPIYSMLVNDIVLYISKKYQENGKLSESNEYLILADTLERNAQNYENLINKLNPDFFYRLREEYSKVVIDSISKLNDQYEIYNNEQQNNVHSKVFHAEKLAALNGNTHKDILIREGEVSISENAINYMGVSLPKNNPDSWLDILLKSSHVKTPAFGYDKMFKILMLARNYVAANTSPKAHLEMIDHVEHALISTKEDEYYWVKACDPGDNSPDFAVTKSQIKKYMKAVPAAGLVYYRDRLKICYRAKTRNGAYLINVLNYGQTGNVRNGHLIVNGGGKNPPNPFNAKIKELLKIDGIQYTRGSQAHRNQRGEIHGYTHQFTLGTSLTKLESITFELTLTTDNQKGYTQPKVFKNLTFNYPDQCHLLNNKTAIFEPIDVNKGFSVDSNCLGMDEVLRKKLGELVNSKEFKDYIVANGENIHPTIKAAVVRAKVDFINYLSGQKSEEMTRLDELSYLLRATSIFRSEMGEVPEWISQVDIFPNLNEVLDIFAIHLQQQDIGDDKDIYNGKYNSILNSYSDSDITSMDVLIDDFGRYIKNNAESTYLDAWDDEDETSYVETRLADIQPLTSVKILKDIKFNEDGIFKLGSCFIGDPKGVGFIGASSKKFEVVFVAPYSDDGVERVEVIIANNESEFILDCHGKNGKEPTYKDAFESTREFLLVDMY